MAPELTDLDEVATLASELEYQTDALIEWTNRSLTASSLLDRISHDEVRRATTAIAKLRHAAERMEMIVAGFVDASNAQFCDRMASSRRWVAAEHGLSHAAASQLVRADAARRRHPRVEQAVRCGELTVAQVDAIAGIIPQRLRDEELAMAIAAVDAILHDLIIAAADLSIDEFSRLCVGARSLLDTDGSERPRSDDPSAPSKLYLTQLFNGRWSLSGDMSADDGALLHSMLDAELAKAARSTGAESGTEPPSESPNEPQMQPQPQRLPRSQQLAAAAMRLVFDGAGASSPGRASIFLHLDLELLRRGQVASPSDLMDGAGVRPMTESNLDLSDDTLWALFAGADVTPVFSDRGRSLSFGRTRRVAPAIQRRVLAYRYRTCAVPGCDVASCWTQAHHVTPWEAGGLTDLDNLRPKCRPHHLGDHAAGVESTELPGRRRCFRRRLFDDWWLQRDEAEAAADAMAATAKRPDPLAA